MEESRNGGAGARALTQFMSEKATSPHLSLSQAVNELREYACIRTLRETLARVVRLPESDADALKKALADALMETNPGQSRNTVNARVSSWLKENRRVMTKANAMEVCFALRLPLDEADRLLNFLCEEGFHWRDPEELIFLYALSRSWTPTRRRSRSATE